MNSGFANWIAQDCSTVSLKLSKSSVCKFSGYALACNIMISIVCGYLSARVRSFL